MIEVYPTPEALAEAVARHVAECAKAAISDNGRFSIALSGGSTPKAAYNRLSAGNWGLAAADWRLTHILWGDERCVPPDDPLSNYRMAKEALLDRVPIPPQNIHRIRGEDEPEQAAAEYERELRLLCHPERSEGARSRLDLVLLGLGEDGHTASLFPGQASVHETERWVLAVPAPDGKLWRVTLTPVTLNAARNICFIVSGGSKAARLQQVIEGPFTPDLLPAQAIHPEQGRLTWMIDAAAGARLRSTLVSR
jgi:6-phosphogluconolactonase